jgi:flagellin-like hook-associated protein FlgL
MDIELNSALRTTIGATQRIQSQLERAQERLATGRKDDDARGNVAAAFVARSLSDRASDLLGVKDTIGQGASKAKVALHGLETVSNTLDQLKAVAQQYQASSNPAEQAALQSQFDGLAQQLDNFTRDSSLGGTNLISADADTLTIPVDESGTSSLIISGQPSDSATLGVAIGDISSIDAAQQQVRAAAQSIGSDASVVAIREDFTDKLVNSLEKGAAKLVQTDLNEEAANAISAQTRGALAIMATGLAAQSERAILQLF